MLEKALRSNRRDVDAWYGLAAVNHREGAHGEAGRCYEKTIALNPAHAEAYYNLGNLRGQTGDLEGAVRCYRKVLQWAPQSVEAARNLGAVLQELGRTDEAIACYREALSRGAAGADIHFNLGNALADRGAYEESIAAYHSALALAPQRCDIHINLGIALEESGDLDQAIVQYRQALEAEPGSRAAARCLAGALAEQGRTADALVCYRQALALAADDGLKLRQATLLPAIPGSLEDMHRWRGRVEAEVARLEAEPLSVADPTEIVGTNFYLSYHGLNNRDLHSRLARLYGRACPALSWVAPHCVSEKPKSGKTRVGFISRFLHDHSIGKTTRGLVANLAREQFEVVSLFAPPSHEDETSRFIRNHSDRAFVLPRILDAARRAIAALELDVLFYQDIGMDPFTYLLAFSRLAPVQCVSFGHPDTTGIAAIDYFVSSDLFEPPGAQGHYSERLFMLNDLGTLAYYYRPLAPAILKRREDFGLRRDANVYLCPQTLFKLHPEFDDILAGILRSDPQGLVVLIRAKSSRWVDLLASRLRETMPDVADRVVFLSRQDSADFRSLLAACDVVLDTIHFSGMNTSLEGFAVGAPIVTLPTELQRGRHTAGMYRKMGFTECVAAGRDDYVRIAVKLGTEGDYRQHVRREILRRNEVLFEDMRAVREFERFFTEATQSLSGGSDERQRRSE